jgi:uncharacterized protein (DUF433 family)
MESDALAGAQDSATRHARQRRDPAPNADDLPIHSDPEIMGGTPVFVDSRVPVQTLYEYLEGGESLEVFLDHFPSVSRERAVAALEMGKQLLLDHSTAA